MFYFWLIIQDKVQTTMFYFVHQIKLQTIPYVQKQIIAFIAHFQNHLDQNMTGNINEVEDKNWPQKTQMLMRILKKKFNLIQNFHYQNWMDYRASLILRSSNLLKAFFQTNRNILQSLPLLKLEIDQIELYNLEKTKLHSPQNNNLKSQQNCATNLKENISKIKKQISKKQKIENKYNKIVKKQNRTEKQLDKIKQKEDVKNKVGKIFNKSYSKNKKQNQLVFGAKKDQSQNKGQENQKIKLKKDREQQQNKCMNQQVTKSIKKSVEKSDSNSKSRVFTHITKKVIKDSAIKRRNVTQTIKVQGQFHKSQDIIQHNVKSNKDQKVKQKRMTKDQYIQHLRNKNKIKY